MPLKCTKSRPVSLARSANHSPAGVPTAAAGLVSSTRLDAGASIISPITTHRGIEALSGIFGMSVHKKPTEPLRVFPLPTSACLGKPVYEQVIARRHGDVLLAVHRVGDRPGRDLSAGHRLPQQCAGLRVEREEVPFTAAGKD